MEAKLQRRVQRYGWDLAAAAYEVLWQPQLSVAQARVLAFAAAQPGEQVLDVACGTGLVALPAAEAVGPQGHVTGIDISGEMLHAAQRSADERGLSNVSFARMDAEQLDLPDASFDVVTCALGLMYVPDPAEAVREMRRVLKPGGRMVIAVWGERAHCGWASVFPIVDAEVASDVCPLFFNLGVGDQLEQLCRQAQFDLIGQLRINTTLIYADADEACRAVFVGGPVSLAWSRFDNEVRGRVRAEYLESIAAWRNGNGYRVPGEFLIVAARAKAAAVQA